MRSRLTVLVAALVVALAGGSAALADADPASDILLAGDVFLPFTAPKGHAADTLNTAVASAYAHGYRLKVAVIAAPTDLGGIPDFFGKPVDYAKFLGTELKFVYAGPLLIVMAAGYGIYDGGRSTAAEERVLTKTPVKGSSLDDLIGSASAAVNALVAAGALKSTDITAPFVAARPASGQRGRIAKLTYFLGDDSKRAGVTIQIRASGKVLKTLRLPLKPVRYGPTYTASWLVPRKAPKVLEFCVVAFDPSGNRSRRSCARLTIG